jgi:hypothetical protein
MREISTHVDIHASASLVWDILTDFAVYRRWNPFIRSVHGDARRGDTILITEQRGAAKRTGIREKGGTTVRRTVKHVREPRELYWLGTWGTASVFASERRFRIETLANGSVRFHQTERFRGAAVPFLWNWLQWRLRPGFSGMNLALKQRAERAHAENEATRTRPNPRATALAL